MTTKKTKTLSSERVSKRGEAIRLVELVDRLIAPGPKAACVSASECHEIADGVHEMVDERRGREADELRSAIERLTAECAASDSSEVREVAEDLQRILDGVDARDSLAYAESREGRAP